MEVYHREGYAPESFPISVTENSQAVSECPPHGKVLLRKLATAHSFSQAVSECPRHGKVLLRKLATQQCTELLLSGNSGRSSLVRKKETSARALVMVAVTAIQGQQLGRTKSATAALSREQRSLVIK